MTLLIFNLFTAYFRVFCTFSTLDGICKQFANSVLCKNLSHLLILSRKNKTQRQLHIAMRTMKQRFLSAGVLAWAVCSLCLLMSCSQQTKKEKRGLQGAWVLTRYVYPEGDEVPWTDKGKQYCQIYNSDSVCYVCELVPSATGFVIHCLRTFNVTFIDKGGDEYLYMEGEYPHPLFFPNDTTLLIQRSGVEYYWTRATQVTDWHQKQFFSMVESNDWADGNENENFVFSTTEEELKSYNHALVFSVLFFLLLALFVVRYFYQERKRNQHLRQQLAQIAEERTQRLLPVQKALEEVESEFFASDYYVQLRKRISAGENLSQAEWDELEQRINPVYPGFTNKLFNLCPMSLIEYHVCLLIKLNVTPTEMANVLNKTTSSISTIRSRLYQKVFQQKGSSRQWDEFILSL